jgi:hypothetical protein
LSNLSKGFKKFVCIGCSHGSLVDQDAFEAVMKFCAGFKPTRRVHLGDVCDYAAFRGGARGTKDEAEAIGPDIRAGATLIKRFRPTDVLIGNHDDRVWKLSNHPNAVLAHAAMCSKREFLTACEKVKAKVVQHYDINRSWIMLGDTLCCHGWMYGENATRDHAEHFGKCIHAHTHTPGTARGRRSDHAVAHCVGTLANIPALDYAKARRATARWAHGLVYGEYNEKECHSWLSAGEPNQAGSWKMPI